MSYTFIYNEWKVRIANDANGDPEYVGEAQPGTATSSSHWRIKKITYSNRKATQVNWASGTKEFDKVWDNRTTYTYS